MENTSSSSKTRSRTAPVSSHAKTEKLQLLLQKRQRSESLPFVDKRRYVPVFYKNPDPVLSRKLKEFLMKPPLNSHEDSQMRAKMVSASRSETPERTNLFTRNRSYFVTPSGERFAHLLPEKRTIHQLVLPPLHAGCRDNFNHKYASQQKEEEPIETGDFSEQMKYLKYCRYLRVRKFPDDSKHINER